jgi:hypothetical protein
MEPYDETLQPAALPCRPQGRDTTLDAMTDINKLPIDPTLPPPLADVLDLAPPDPLAQLEPPPTQPSESGSDSAPKREPRVRARTVILATAAAILLTTLGALALVARHQASAKLNTQRKLATASNQLATASQELGRSSSSLTTTQSSLADTQTLAQTAEDALGQARAVEVDAIAPFLVDQTTTLDEARCIVNGVIDRLGLAAVMRYDNSAPSTPMPPELSRAIYQAAAGCVPGAPTA